MNLKWFKRSLASVLAAGSIAILSFARNFESVPVSIFGVSFATAIFPSLSRKAALGDTKGFLYHLKEAVKPLLIVSVASSLFFIFFGEFFIRIFFGGQRFTEADVLRTGKLLAFFALAIPAESFIHLLVRAFYALKDTLTPILISVPGLVLIAILAKVLIPTFSLNAMGLSYFIASTIEALVLFFILRIKLSKL